MFRFNLFNQRVRRTSLFMIMVVTLVLAALPTAVMAAPAASHGYDDRYGCGDCYVVKPGDTLSEIAKWLGVSTWALAKYNGISNPSKIYVGQKLRIPKGYCDGCGYDHGYKDDYKDKYGCDGCAYDHGYKDDYKDKYGCDGCGYDHGYKDGYKDDYGCDGCGYDHGYKDGYKDDYGCDGCGYDHGYYKSDYKHDYGCDGCGYDHGYKDGYKDDYGCGGCGYYHKPDYGHDYGCGGCGYDRKPDYGYDHGCRGCGHGYYIVKRGDTLSQIAKWYGVSVHYLARKNGISNPSKIYVGQKIYI